jgi:hypothetical protein
MRSHSVSRPPSEPRPKRGASWLSVAGTPHNERPPELKPALAAADPHFSGGHPETPGVVCEPGRGTCCSSDASPASSDTAASTPPSETPAASSQALVHVPRPLPVARAAKGTAVVRRKAVTAVKRPAPKPEPSYHEKMLESFPDLEDDEDFWTDPQGRVEGRHSRLCLICRHPGRAAIEQEFIEWRSPRDIARRWFLPDHNSVYRHARACNLFAPRRVNFRSVLECLMECADDRTPSSSAIVQAVRLYASLPPDDRPARLAHPERSRGAGRASRPRSRSAAKKPKAGSAKPQVRRGGVRRSRKARRRGPRRKSKSR